MRLKSGSGADLVPWMNDTDFEKIAQAKKDREERKNRQTESRVDTMNLDPQASEQSGTGSLNSKVLSEEEVELRWSTEGEEGNVRTVKSQNQKVLLAKYQTADFADCDVKPSHHSPQMFASQFHSVCIHHSPQMLPPYFSI